MGILFTTGTINQPDSGSVGQAMVERIRDDVVAHDAWELVEEFTPAAGTARYYVFKCLSTASGLDHDFFMVISRTLANGKLYFTICDTYNAGPHEMQGWPNGYNSYVAYDEYGRMATPYALPVGGLPDEGNPNSPSTNYWTPAGTSTKWWLCVGEEHVTVAFNGASNAFIHIGAFDYLGQLDNNGLDWQMVGINVGNGAIISNPSVANANISNQFANVHRFRGGGGNLGVQLGFAGPWKYNDKLQNNQRPVSEIGMVMDSVGYPENGPAVIGYVLGKQRHMRWSGFAMPDGLAFGDAFALNGKLWVPWLPTDGRIFDSGVASS